MRPRSTGRLPVLREGGDKFDEAGEDGDLGEGELGPAGGVVFAGADSDGVDAGVAAGVDVGLAVADHVAVRGIETVPGNSGHDSIGGAATAPNDSPACR